MDENTFTMNSWDEQVVDGAEGGPRFASARARFEYRGAIRGNSVCDYLLYYPGEGYDGDGHTSPGIERVSGSVDGHSGSFLIRHEVGYGPEGIHGTWTVIPGSGTGDLAGMSGGGTITGSSETMSYTIEYALS